jgi:diguanylate cyclase (GGDEF)-like protein
VTGRAIALADPSGAVTGYLGTITDVTERARAEREQSALRRVATAVASDAPSRSIFALVAEQVAHVLDVPTCSVVQFDAGEQVALVVGGWSERQGVASPGARLSLDDGRVLTRVFRAGQAVRSEDPLDLGDVTGETQEPGADVVSVTAAPVWMGRDLWGAIAVAGMNAPLPADTDDRLERFCELVGLALANADARRQLAALASTDHLTGLPNRRSFQERLAAEVERARKRDRPLALVVFDIDHFKEINDGRGHETGDRVLIEFSHRLAALARSGEVVARIGGEEFAWILPETDAMGALAAAQRARQRIAAEPFPTVGTVTVSGGVCDLEQASGAPELFRFADVALYWAKGQGRNAVFRYSPEVVELLSAEEQQRRMRRAQALSGVRALANAVDAKDAATQRHSERVAELAEILSLASGWTPERAAHMREAALVHDVGKIGVRDSVLSNPGRLSEEEYAEVQQHVILGARMVEGLLDDEQVAWLRHHHERWDGRGYPDRLAGSEIPEGARILALADAWDAMTTPRPYGPNMTIGEGMREMQRLSGTQFDPALVESLGRLWARGDLALSEHDVELSR